MLQSMRSNAKYIWIVLAVVFVGVFVFAESSGLLGGGPAVTTTTEVAEVNGETILATDWYRAVQQRDQQESQRAGRALTLDEQDRIKQQVFDEMVSDILLRQELARRKLGASDQEVVAAAQQSPPPEIVQNPEFQTEGRFDPAKYQRYLASPNARAGGVLAYLEQYYRQEIPRQKLYAQVAGDVYVSDARLWQLYQDTHDSAQVSFVAFRPELVPDAQVSVSDAEIQAYYDRNRKAFDRPGRATVSLLTIPRAITAADTAAARARAEALRAEIAGGAKFEDVARRESADSGSAANGGELGQGGRGRFVPEFEQAAYALQPGQLSQPVQTQFGFHVIRVDARRGDTLSLRHILVPIAQSDSTATRTDRRADSLANVAASSDDPKKFDEAVRRFGLTPVRATVVGGEPLTVQGRYVPSVSAWAFSGVRPGETSELFDAPDAYYLARLDSVTKGGAQPLAAVREEIRGRLLREKKLAALVPRARQLAQAAAGSSLDAAAQAQGLTVEKTGLFTRASLVPGLGQYTQAVGAAFAVPQGTLTQPVVSRDAVYVMRVDRRIAADKGAWQAQKRQQREQVTPALRQARVREFLAELREAAKVEDRREEVEAASRRQATS